MIDTTDEKVFVIHALTEIFKFCVEISVETVQFWRKKYLQAFEHFKHYRQFSIWIKYFNPISTIESAE